MENNKYLLGVAMIVLMILTGCGTPTQEPIPIIIPTSLPTLSSTAVSTMTVEPTSPANKTLLIYDDDGNRDGMAALIYLLINPDFSVEAICISYGEAHPEIFIQHVGRVLDDLGFQDIPLGAGQDTPLVGGTPFPDWLRQISDNFFDYPLPNADETYPFQNAPELMVSTINQNSEPVTIFLSGPFTNLAQALRIDPHIRENIKAVYFMGGAVYSPGNITNLILDSSNSVSEWNIIADPQAAKEVFEAGLDMYMIPLDATNQVMLRIEDTISWHNGSEKADFVADLFDIMFINYGFESYEIFDLTAAVLTVKPELCVFQKLHLDVITDDGNTLGQTIVVPNREPNIHVCLEPNVAQVKQNLNESFSSTIKPPEIPSIDPLVGTWTGSALNNGFEMQVSITIEKTCQLGQVCGRFNIPTASCSGTLIWVGMDGELYQFQAGDKTAGCGEGIDYLVPQKDGTVMFISRGDYGETIGILQREP